MRSSSFSLSFFLFLVIAVTAAVAGCTKNNPDVCCVSAVDCARLGVDEPRPCEVGQACRDFGCVAAECATSADCTSPGAPVCVDQLCVAACREDADCTGAAAGPICAPDGACVGCLADAQCPASAPFCDAEDRACRGCEQDAECASGVCIEADGACVATTEAVVYLSSAGADSGECTVAAPCRTLAYALQQVTPARQVIHVTGGSVSVGATAAIAKSAVIDGTMNRLVGSGTGPLLTVSAGVVTVEGIELEGSSGAPTVTVDIGSTLRLFDVKLRQANVHVTSAAIELRKGRLANTVVDCTSGTATIRESQIDTGGVRFANCQTIVERNRFEPAFDGSIDGHGGLLSVKNNIFIVPSEYPDLIRIGGNAPGSIISFNTIVNTSTVTDSAVAIGCSSPVTLTSNIIAYNSTNPLVGCEARFSLFDLPGAPDAAGNTSADAATFFRDRANGDFHLAPASPALGTGEPSIVANDFDGHPRPAPLGSAPDIGAYEAP
jgi:hypothetical protein